MAVEICKANKNIQYENVHYGNFFGCESFESFSIAQKTSKKDLKVSSTLRKLAHVVYRFSLVVKIDHFQ